MRVLLTLICLALGLGASPGCKQPESTSPLKHTTMNKRLDSLLQEADWEAVDVAEQQGSAALDVIERYLSHSDPRVRLLVVDCVVAADGDDAAALLVKALRDDDEQIRANAMNGLKEHLPNGMQGELLAVLREADFWYLRQQIPMALAKMGNSSVRSALQSVYTERSPDDVRVQTGYRAALAKLGDPQAREAFAEQLSNARGEEVYRLMELVRYIGEPWLIPSFLPLLEQKEVAKVYRSGLGSSMTIRRRTCDLAVDAVLDLSDHSFSFEKDRSAQYTDEQIAEVTRYVQDYIRKNQR